MKYNSSVSVVDGCVNMTSLQCWMVDHCRLWPSQWWETSSCLDLIYPPSNLRRLITDLQKLSANEKRLIERERERERRFPSCIPLDGFEGFSVTNKTKSCPLICLAVWVHVCFSPGNCMFSPMFTPFPQKYLVLCSCCYVPVRHCIIHLVGRRETKHKVAMNTH